MKKTIVLFLVLIPFFSSAANDHLVINQIQITGGPGHASEDFVEIYNPTSTDIDLDGHRLVKRSQNGSSDTLLKSWTTSTVIPAGGYYLWANSNFATVTADITTSGTISDDNGVALRLGPNDTGTIIDSVAWGTVSNGFGEGIIFPTNPTANEVLMRSADTDDNSVDFAITVPNPRTLAVSPAPTPTPSPVPNPPPAPNIEPAPSPSPPPPIVPAPSPISDPVYTKDLMITEFLANPDGPDDGEEWVEIFNNGPFEVDLMSWVLDDEAPSNGGIGSSAYKVPSIKIPTQAYGVVMLGEHAFALNNTGGDSVRLFSPDNKLVYEVKYEDAAKTDMVFSRTESGNYEWTSNITKGTANVPALQSTEPEELKEGEIAGVALPVTGGGFPVHPDVIFVFLATICYIYVRLTFVPIQGKERV